MIEALTFFLLFGIAYHFNRSNTYLILFVASLLNVLIYGFTNTDNALPEGTLDYIVLLTIIALGDKHVLYQAGLIVLGLTINLSFEGDQISGGNVVFSSFGAIITLITIMQLAGGGYGIIARILERVFNSNSDNGLFDHSFNTVGKKTCQKQKQSY